MKMFSTVLKVGSFLMLAWMTSCSSYSKHQDEADKNGPVDCVDLHVRNAEWHFTDRGVHFDVIGTCKKGMRHGNFRFFADGNEVAVVKYSKDSEVKVKCVIAKNSMPVSFQECLSNINPQGSSSAESKGALGGSAWDQPID
jgi:hypothetical protein